MMENSFMQWLFPARGNHSFRAAHWIKSCKLGLLQIVETEGKEHEMITELIIQLALRGPYNLIAVDEWLPDRDTLYRSVRRYTLRIEETLDRPKIKRPMTCLQLLDLLVETDLQSRPTLVLNFLHHFYNADVKLSLRDRILEQCCRYTRLLSLCNPVVVFVPRRLTEEYNRFFPILAAVADEIIPVAECVAIKASQNTFFWGGVDGIQ
jgi:hypothetical protein